MFNSIKRKELQVVNTECEVERCHYWDEDNLNCLIEDKEVVIVLKKEFVTDTKDILKVDTEILGEGKVINNKVCCVFHTQSENRIPYEYIRKVYISTDK